MPVPVPDRPAAPGEPGFPQLPPDTAGAGALAAARARAPRVAVRDVGPGEAGRRLREALARPHLLVVAPDTGLTLGRAVAADTTLIVVGPARVAGTVRGDLLALGDLYLRPGAVVEGDAVAVGGRVMESSLARVDGRMLGYERVGFAALPEGDGTLALRVRALEAVNAAAVVLPGFRGFRLPSYDRIDGLSLTFGPEIRLDTGRVRIEPTVTWRTHLGTVDPGLRVQLDASRRTTVEVAAARGTWSNDAWIRGDIINSALALGLGSDTRNWYRADRATGLVRRRWETTRHVVEPFVGAQLERAWSVPRDSGAASAPYSVLRRDDPEGIRRFNPAVTGGRIASLLAGARWRAETETSTGDVTLQVEQAVDVARGSPFAQATFDAEVALPGFRDHRLALFAHAVGTLGGTVPSQRYAYVGGGGTIPSRFLLDQGGDQLAWAETRYTIPVPVVRLPFAGAPSVTLRHIVGGAGVDRLPALTQNLGLRVTVAMIRVDYTFDPSGRGRRDFSVGVGLR
ncbi:polymer-forming cytoskeletal protein [Roseisolibacter sp. H3M3-2]|uniref:polymer-forming cytoskeletal protein n=1 Tax=Roseisolibacter sp. H3M3-2 TaxID=3031323 RepID=UPI0023DC02E0|nr:polymer-forming cytoskeletal protein [Roseisolibacter sp. H3M3-2]